MKLFEAAFYVYGTVNCFIWVEANNELDASEELEQINSNLEDCHYRLTGRTAEAKIL
ncbi:hypothetical protein ACXD9I_003679 [Yersinia enterocolitica]|nr:hypothetical protein [Yersinia enterocolitica]